jgi:hypothetical protein
MAVNDAAVPRSASLRQRRRRAAIMRLVRNTTTKRDDAVYPAAGRGALHAARRMTDCHV